MSKTNDAVIPIVGFVILRTVCGAGKDGACICDDCPQMRDNEPYATGRSCPLPDVYDDLD